MKDFIYVIKNFFTHKDFLVSPELIPGTIYTPLHLIFEAIVLAILLSSSIYIAKHKKLIIPCFKGIWYTCAVWEIVIILWDSFAGKQMGMDWANSLSLYPCSLFLYTLPFIIWGKGLSKKIAYGYLFTLGMLGGLINIIYPVTQLTSYSCISFVGFHTTFYHNSILFVFLVCLLSGRHSYRNIRHTYELLIPSLASLLLSIPANIINFSPINSDYMFFKGEFAFLKPIFSHVPMASRVVILYMAYIIIPALFYLPSYLVYKYRKSVYEISREMEGKEEYDNQYILS